MHSVEMPFWYYDKNDLRNTVSIRDGLDYDTERRYREEGARFIMECGKTMGLGHNTYATGVVYFHRFYMFHSFRTFPRYVTACCCLFLAGKVEETPKKCLDIIKTARSLLSDNAFKSFGDDPKEEVMTLERILLQTIKFDLQVEHPYGFLLKYAKCLIGNQTKLNKMVQMAWNFINDSMAITVCLQWEPEIVAIAMIYLASKIQFKVEDWVGRQPHHLCWWDMFVSDVTLELLEDICHQMLDFYKEKPSRPDSPPQLPTSKTTGPTTSTPITKRIPVSPAVKKVAAANAGTGVSPVALKNVTIVTESMALDNQPIPKLITTGDSMAHYQPYTTQPTYGNPVYAHPAQYPGNAPNQLYAMNQFSQPNAPFPPVATQNYYQPPPPPPPPAGQPTIMPNYYHAPP